MSEIKTIRCDVCKATDGRMITVYVRTECSPWFGVRRDFCVRCASAHPIRVLLADLFDAAIDADAKAEGWRA